MVSHHSFSQSKGYCYWVCLRPRKDNWLCYTWNSANAYIDHLIVNTHWRIERFYSRLLRGISPLRWHSFVLETVYEFDQLVLPWQGPTPHREKECGESMKAFSFWFCFEDLLEMVRISPRNAQTFLISKILMMLCSFN